MTKEEKKAFDAATTKVKDLEQEVQALKDQVAWFQRQHFGSKSERFIDSNQISLDLGLTSKEISSPEYEDVTVRKKRKVTPHSRKDIPDFIPEVVTTIEPDCDTAGMEKIDVKVTRYLEWKPAEFFVNKIERPVYVSVDDNNERSIIHADLPSHCIDKGKAGASLVAQTIITKCVDHNPLYRFAQQINRDCQMDIAESTLQGWYEKGVFWLETIRDKIRAKIAAASYLQIDETTIKTILKPKKGKSKTAYMWVYFDPIDKGVLFDFNLRRTDSSLVDILGETSVNVVQSDGYNVYDSYCSPKKINQAGCMAHARRKFSDARSYNRIKAEYILDKIKSLFMIEREALEKELTPDERLILRKKKSQVILDRMNQWCKDTYKMVTPTSTLGKAISYMLNQWEKLTYFMKDGRVELSTNWIENEIRPFVIGRKNFLFAGSKIGGERLATIYTVIATAKQYELNPRRYLTTLFEELPKRKSNDIDDLLPWNWKEPSKEIQNQDNSSTK
jgi:IS1 family transposase